MTAWALLRFGKFVCVALLAAGCLGGVFGSDAVARRRWALAVGTPAMIGVLIFGYALTKATGASIGDPWISRSLFSGLVGFGAACWVATSERTQPVSIAICVAGLLGAFGWMSARTLGQAWILGALVPVALAVPVAAWVGRRDIGAPDGAREDATLSWFAWLARAEGVSLLLLFGLYMPLKHAAGVVLDGGQGWFGWAHGVLQLVYLVALVVTAHVHRWSGVRQVLGFVASLLPLGTFWFERRVRAG